MDTMIRRGIADNFDFISADAMKKHPYCHELLRPMGLPRRGVLAANEKRGHISPH